MADGLARSVADARAGVEANVLRISNLVASLLLPRQVGSVGEHRAQAHAALDESFAAVVVADTLCDDERRAREAAQTARDDERVCEQQIATIDANNAPLVNAIARLRTERARIARHHQPKIDRAEKRVRRLAYVTGSATTEVTVVSQGESES